MGEPLHLERVAVRRGGRRVLRDVSFTVEPGAIWAILGPNGAGKSTLLDAIAGLHGAQVEGELRLGTVALGDLPRRERALRLAYVPQQSHLDAPMRVEEVVAQGRFVHRRGWGGLSPDDRLAVEEALAATDTARLAQRPFTAISQGERRRVLIARALATGARVLLLDEPTAALDVGQALQLFDLLRRLAAEGRQIVVVLHSLSEALQLAGHALLLDEGRPVALGPIAEVVTAEPVRRVYGVELVAGGGFGYRPLGGAR